VRCRSGVWLQLFICAHMTVFKDGRMERKHLPCSLHVGRGRENVCYQCDHTLRMNCWNMGKLHMRKYSWIATAVQCVCCNHILNPFNDINTSVYNILGLFTPLPKLSVCALVVGIWSESFCSNSLNLFNSFDAFTL